MATHRIEKFSALLKREVSNLIEEDFAESFGLISITDVFVSADLKYAKLYLTSLNSENITNILKSVNNKSYYYQRLLGRKLKMKFTPKLEFLLDTGQAKVDKIDSLLKDVNDGS